jgi:formate dehydrogenase
MVCEAELYGRLDEVLQTVDAKVDVAPAPLVTEARRLLHEADEVLEGFPLQLITRRRTESMNSWLNDAPSIHVRTSTNLVELNEVDAAELGISSGDPIIVESPVSSIRAIATVSDKPRPGVVVCEHGWGSAVLDPATGGEPIRYGVNRNLLVSRTIIDPLSQSPRLNGQPIRIRLDTALAGSP